MSPDRQRLSTSLDTTKPYSRPATPSGSPPQCPADIAQEESLQEVPQGSSQTTVVPSNKPGFPTYQQYKHIEDTYIQSISPCRREKSLISQALFDRIWAVLHSIDSPTESPQFRFWARKQFSLGKLKKSAKSFEASESDDESGVQGQTVLLHQQVLVAVQEQIYDILCYGHGISNHGGRDRTCSSIRKHYAWIPKELVTQFVRVCPTCIAKKFGVKGKDGSLVKNLQQYLHDLGAAEGPGQVLPSLPDDKESIIASSESDNRLDRTANLSALVELQPPQSLPMSREVSLYQGLPNGWQFRHNDISEAQDEFAFRQKPAHASSSEARSKRPRIPSIAPMMRALSAPMHGDTNGMLSPTLDLYDTDAERASASRPKFVTLHSLPGSPLLPQDINDPNHANTETTSSASFAIPASTSHVRTRPIVPTSITRAAAPPSIDLQALNSQKTIEAFLALRGRSGLTPDSDSPQPTVALPSPAYSDTSSLSTLAMVATASASPANSALPTPVDRPASDLSNSQEKDLAQQTGLMMLNVGAEAVCDHGPSAIVL